MKWIKFKYILLLIILLALVSAMACKTKLSGEAKPKLYFTIEGTVKNPAGFAVSGVRVEVADYVMKNSSASKPTGTFATLTDSDGAFTLEILAYDDIGKVTLKFSKSGLTNNYRDVGVVQGLSVTVSALIAPAGSFQTVDFAPMDDSTIPAPLPPPDTITVTGGEASITINRGTLRNAAGASVSAARVSIAAIDSTADRTLLPGSLYGVDGSTVKLFSTFGMVEIQVIDNAEGDPVYLASGATAAVSIPVGDIVGSDPSATVGLWYYNEESATWMLEGNLTLNNAGTAYEGNIKHFSLYNAGESWDVSYIKIRVVDQNLEPVIGAKASFFTGMFSNNGIWQEDYTTGPEGYFPSILDSSLTSAGVVPNDMAGYLPLPADAAVNVRIKYIKTSDSKNPVFLFPDPSPDPDGGEAEIKYELIVTDPGTGQIVYVTNPETEEDEYTVVDQEDIPTPYTFTTAAAGEITHFNLVSLQLETSAFLTARVVYENGDPATGHWLRFMTSEAAADQISASNMDSDGNFLWVVGTTMATGFQYKNDKKIRLPANTTGFMVVTTGPPTGGVEYLSWFVDGGGTLESYDDYQGDNGGPGIAKWYTTGDKGTSADMQITLKGGGSSSGGEEEEVVHTYLTGTAKLANGDPAPEGSWVVFNGESSGVPVVVRAQVGANGLFPDPTGPFDVAAAIAYEEEGVVKEVVTTVKVGSQGGLVVYVEPSWVPARITEEGDLEGTIGGEWVVLAEDVVFYVELQANIKYTNTQLLDVTTDPLNPDVLFTYNYEAKGADVFTSGVTIGPNSTVSGIVYTEGGLGKDLMVTFTKVDAVTECAEEGDPDYDEDCEVDEPVTDITDTTGAYEVDLEINTEYVVTVSTHDGNTPLDTLYTFIYEPEYEDATAVEDFDIAIGGISYMPVVTVTGTVVYEGAYGAGLEVVFEKTVLVGNNITVYDITDEGGKYSAELNIDTEYTVTVYEYDDETEPPTTTLLYPSDAYPVEGGLKFTASDDEDTLDIQIGAGLSGDTIPHIPAGKVGVKGVVLNVDGTIPSATSYMRYSDGTTTKYARIDQDTGEILELSGGQPTGNKFLQLLPDTTYTYSWGETTSSQTEILQITTPALGVVQTLKLILPAEGGTQTTNAYVKGVVKNADGTIPSATSYMRYSDGTTTKYARIDQDTGEILELSGGQPTGNKFLQLLPDTTYTYSWGETTSTQTEILQITTPASGVVQTIKLILPAEGGTQTTNAYVRGIIMYEDDTIPPENYGAYTNVGTAQTKYAKVDQDNAEMLELAQGALTGNAFLQLPPDTAYQIGYGGYGAITQYLDITTPQSGVVMSISVEIPNPEE